MSNNPKSIPVPPQQRLAAAIESRVKHPLYPAVVEAIEAQDLLILAEVITDRKPLGWVIEALNTPETEIVQKSKMIDTACKVFDGIVKAIEAETRAAYALPEIEMAKRFALEILRWAEGGWQVVIEGFEREMRGINPATLTEHLGFTDHQVALSQKVDGKPQWGVLSLYDVAYRVTSDEAVLQNRAFRRAALSGFASFFRFAFGQTGSEDEELLDWADEIASLLYGDDAKLTDRSRRNNTPSGAPKPISAEVRAKKAARSAASKEVRKAMQQPKGAKPQAYGRKS
jgi:hypothetical protein